MSDKERNDRLADLCLLWLGTSERDRQQGVNVLLSRNLVYFDHHLKLKVRK
jgi:hypothetical protein